MNLFNLTLIGAAIMPKGFFTHAASGVLGGFSVAALVMLLTLRSIRRAGQGGTPAEANR